MGCGVVLGDAWSGPLADGLEYRDGSIASQELLKNSSGATTLFAIDAGQSVGETSQPYDAMIHVLEGAFYLTKCHHFDGTHQPRPLLPSLSLASPKASPGPLPCWPRPNPPQ